MPIGNVSIQTSGGASTLGVIQASGVGFSFLNPLYRYANLTLPYSPNDPGLSFTYNNSTLAPVVLLYARFFNLLNEASVPVIANVGTSAFSTSGALAPSGVNCLDVRSFGAVGDGVADDTVAIQAALDQAYQNYLGNLASTGGSAAVQPQLVQSIQAHVENGAGTQLSMSFLLPVTVNNKIIIALEIFDYSGQPTVSDNFGNVYTSFGSIQNGQHNLALYWANVGTAGLLTVTVTISGLRFNSFMAAIAAEMAGATTAMLVDGFSTSAIPIGNSFVPASVPLTNQNDLVLSLIYNDRAAGTLPTMPPGYRLIGAQATPQPNGLNGSIPVTAMAYAASNGTLNTIPQWSSTTWDGNALTVLIRLTPIATSAAKGFTTVCIPSGVACMVSPVGLDERNLPMSSCRFGPAAYSLLIQDGVTLLIDGALIANKNATASMVSSDHSGDFGWFLVMNKAWTQNASILKAKQSPGLDQVVSAGNPSATLASLPFGPFTPQTSNEIVFTALSTILGQSISPNGSKANTGSTFLWLSTLTAQTTFTAAFTPGVGAAIAAASFNATGPVGVSQSNSGSSFAAFPFSSAFASGVPSSHSILVGLMTTDYQGVADFVITDDKGNTYQKIIFSSTGVLQAGLWFCESPNGSPKTITISASGAIVGGQAVITIADLTNIGGLCGQPISWPSYLAGTAFNEGPRNKGIRITGNGQVKLNGDSQVNNATNPNGQLFPVGLARFVCVDSSSISNLEIVNPFGCAIQWLNSNAANIQALYIHDASNVAATNVAVVTDPGIIEMDMLRNSLVENNIVSVCPASKGILDWAGYQNTVLGNTLDTCYTGYEFRDSSGEMGYYFSVGPVTHNSEITQNKATNMQTAPASAGPFGSQAGSNGFLFFAGFRVQATRSSSTGTSFHDNIGNNNSTDFSYTTFTGFRSLLNNTFGTSSGSGTTPGGTVSNSQNTVTGEVPTGVVDGVNVTFTLAHIPITSSMTVYLNGLYEVFGTDYTVSGNQIIFSTPPNVGSKVSVNYQYLTGN